ncbi:DNA modification methylase [Candidatus Hydrogenedentota bacterium]
MKVRQMNVGELKPWKDNPRRNEQAVGAVAKSIKTFGFNVPILCDENLQVISGHTRLKAAEKLGMKSVPVIVLKMSDKERRAYAVADNKTAEISDWDTPKLRKILEELRSEDVDVRSLGFSSGELRWYLEDDADKEDRPVKVSKRGRAASGAVFALGKHRLICGDSRYKKDLKCLLGNTKVDHVFAGPPYFNQREYSQWQSYEQYLRDMRRVAERCYSVLKPGGVVVWNISNESSTNHALVTHHSEILDKAGLKFLDTIIWVKNGPNYESKRYAHIKRSRCYYPAFQWEALLVFQKEGNIPKMTTEGALYMWRHHTDVWRIPAVTNQMRTHGHPAVCPVEIPYRTLQAYTSAEATVLDPFGGSGTTLIAAEKLGKRAFLIERSPTFCDAIIKRWEKYVGRKARRLA